MPLGFIEQHAIELIAVYRMQDLVGVDSIGLETYHPVQRVDGAALHNDRAIENPIQQSDHFESLHASFRQTEVDRFSASRGLHARIATALVNIDLVSSLGQRQS
jgi:hypothetical protein